MTPRSPWRGIGTDVVCVGLILLAWSLFWWPVLVDGELLYIRDLVFFALPAKQYLFERVAAGELPQWTPQVSAGMPFLADAANQALYPVNALLAMLTPVRAITGFGLLHTGIAMLGAYALARALGVGAPFALWAGLGYGMSGYVVSITDNLNYMAGAAWLPVALAYHVGAVRGGGIRQAVGAALALAMMLLAGDALAAGLAVATAALLSLAVATGSGVGRRDATRPAPWLPLLAWLVMVVCGALLAGAQVVPTLMWIQDSARAAAVGLEEATQFSLPPARLLELVQPYLFGAKYPALEFFAGDLYPARGTPWAASIHVGLVPVLAALTAAWLRPRNAWPWLVLAVLSALLALGRHTPLFELAHAWLPMVDAQRYPEKLVLPLTLAIAVLAALGAQALYAGPLSRPLRRPVYLAVVAGIVLFGFVLTLWWPVRALLAEHARGASFFYADLFGLPVSHMQGLALHTAAVCAVLAIALAVHAWRPAAGFVLVGVFALADLGLVNRSAAPTATAQVLELDRRPVVLDALPALVGARILYEAPGARAGSPQRLRDMAAQFADIRSALAGGIHLLEVVRRSREGLARNEGARHGVDYANGLYSPLQPAAPAFLERLLLAEDRARFVRLTSVDFVLTSPLDRRWPGSDFEVVHEQPDADLRVLRPLHSPPRALLVPNAVVFDGPVEAGREVIYSIDDFRSHVILDAGDDGWSSGDEQPLRNGASISMERQGPERIALVVDSPYPHAWLRVDESFAPGWTAKVDGRPAPLRRADFRAMAVGVPSGSHEVVLEYQTPGLRLGLRSSQIGMVLLLAIAWLGSRHARRRASRP